MSLTQGAPIHRFFCPALSVSTSTDDLSDRLVTLDADETHHAQRVVRLGRGSRGDAVELFDGRGLVAVGKWQGDVLITREEIRGLMRDLLCVDSTPTGTTRLTDWAREHASERGVRYASELARRTDRTAAYAVVERSTAGS